MPSDIDSIGAFDQFEFIALQRHRVEVVQTAKSIRRVMASLHETGDIQQTLADAEMIATQLDNSADWLATKTHKLESGQ